jgi:hypothetical protein
VSNSIFKKAGKILFADLNQLRLLVGDVSSFIDYKKMKQAH